MTTYALNEWDFSLPASESWKRKLDSQRGAVLANELKNNACKLSKWTAQSLLAGEYIYIYICICVFVYNDCMCM
jgi:translation initiation factor 3 subunit D